SVTTPAISGASTASVSNQTASMRQTRQAKQVPDPATPGRTGDTPYTSANLASAPERLPDNEPQPATAGRGIALHNEKRHPPK
ncbi:MAG: hypothetical protein WD534_04115, partial [Phycisphaeraceae bacterium]